MKKLKKHLCFYLILLLCQSVNAQTWSSVGSGLHNGGTIYSMCEYNGELYVGGTFDSIGGLNTHTIARWNGSAWDSVPGAYLLTRYNQLPFQEFFIHDMVVYNGELIVGGIIWENGNQWAGIAKWDGNSWSYLGSGTDGKAYDVGVYNGELYATGSFSTAGGISTRSIARWDGVSWDNVGGPGINTNPGGIGNELQVYNGELYLAGSFNWISGLSANYIARWDGLGWDSVGTSNPLGGHVNLGVYNNKLYATGNINTNNFTTSIARWDNMVWDTIGSGLNQSGASITTEYNNELYVAGGFDTAGSIQALGIARWNEVQWDSVGSGLNLYQVNIDTLITPIGDTLFLYNEAIYTMCVYDNELYVGGLFSQAGGIIANSIAKWHIIGVSNEELESKSQILFYPNPFNTQAYLKTEIPFNDAEITIRNMVGRIIVQFENVFGSQFEIKNENFSAGIYICTVSQQDKIWIKKIVIE
jgi:type IX secretion system substrate protein